LVEVPVIEGESSIYGGSIRWDWTDDPRIHQYEVQVDDVNSFPTPTTYTVLEPFFGLENVATTKYLRARAVRFNGQTGNWSNTYKMSPTTSAPECFSKLFYQGYDDSVQQPPLETKVQFSGEPAPKFYVLFEHDFYAKRETGGMVVFGYISNHLEQHRTGEFVPWDRVRFRVQGLTRMEEFFPLWAIPFNYPDNVPYNPDTGDPLTFYAHGGYSAAFGPWMQGWDEQVGIGPFDPKRITEPDGGPGSFYWEDPKAARRPSRLDQGYITDFAVPWKADAETASWNVRQGATTTFLKCQDFGFDMPDGLEVEGIKLWVKRRTNLWPDNTWGVDWGFYVNLFDLSDDAFGTPGLSDSNIKEANTSVDFETFGEPYGLMLEDVGPGGDGYARNQNSPNLSGVGDDNAWTLTCWLNKTTAFPNSTFRHTVFHMDDVGGFSAKNFISLQMKGEDLIVSFTDDAAVRNVHNFWVYDVFAGLNWWHHIGVTFDSGTLRVYVDGIRRNADATDGSDPAVMTFTEQPLEVHVPLQSGAQVTDKFNIGQTGYWNKALEGEEIEEIFKHKFLINLRANAGDYESAANLMHYWFVYPKPNGIEDYEVYIVDKEGDIRTDLTNKANTGERWPNLEKFYVEEQMGIPHDNVVGLGYQEYGGLTDTWGDNFYADDVNSSDFGVAFRAKNLPGLYWSANAYVDHIKMAIYYSDPAAKDWINCKVEAEAGNFFYMQREVWGGLFNAIEVGEDIGD
jgi:hypothetical protein